MIPQRPRDRLAGWFLSGTGAAALLCAAAAIALAGDRQAPILILDLAATPPAAPAVAAIAEAAPQVADRPPPAPEAPPDDELAPKVPTPTLAPDLPDPHLPAPADVSLPLVEAPVTADLTLPPPPEKPAPKEKAAAKKPVAKPDPDPKSKAETPKETSSASAGAPKTADKPKSGGAVSPAAYAKAVMKKVRSTRKASGNGRGTVVVGFSIGPDGTLAAVTVLQSSGNAALDQTALDHIRRSAPFPVPPDNAGSSYSFEFVGK